jgi:uncharacterized protein (TIGR02266 family)
MGDERRREPREAISLVVEYDDSEDLLGDYTENLSTGGTFVHTDRDLPIGTTVRLMLSFPGLLRPIALAGTVRWLRDDGDARGVGIEFSDYDARVRVELAALIAGIRGKSPELVRRVVRILVVEDNPHVARFIRDGLSASEALRPLTFEFVTENDGRAALQRLERESLDAAIVDMYLPVMDGSHLIAHIRRDPKLRALPVIAVSAGGSSAREAALQAGADLFLDKPMRLRQIIESMGRLIGLGTR